MAAMKSLGSVGDKIPGVSRGVAGNEVVTVDDGAGREGLLVGKFIGIGSVRESLWGLRDADEPERTERVSIEPSIPDTR
jgi:hypothetical protein